MHWAHYSWIFLISAVKFLFAPPSAIHFVSYWECIVVTTAGGITGVTFFYFMANILFKRTLRKRREKDEKLKIQGIVIIRKKFTRTNKFVVRTKRTFGLWGLACITPALISIPIGSVLLARFYPNAKITLPVVYAFVVAWSFILTSFGSVILGWFGYH
ncbi:MAG: hypothetical protein ACHQF2_06345 [Flavobacteriales bacterium]